MNTKIEYMLRDADNFKFDYAVVLKGKLTKEEKKILPKNGMDFIPSEVGLPNLLPDDPDPERDGIIHELLAIEDTDAEPDFPRTAKRFIKMLKKAPFNVEKATKELFGDE